MTAHVIEQAYAHLDDLSDSYGVFEHADHALPRREHGYCVDDMARVLVVTTQAPLPRSARVSRLGELALEFVRTSQVDDGAIRNRRAQDGSWESASSTEDCWGRALWGLGISVADDPDATRRKDALVNFEQGAWRRSPWRRSMAFAALGAAAVLEAEPENELARDLLREAAQSVRARDGEADAVWPEVRLTYANAVIPNALLAAGTGLLDDDLIADGLCMLGWLVEHELEDGHFSVTSSAGSPLCGRGTRFDQQAIEVAALAEACARAYAITGNAPWAERTLLAEAWFMGSNDLGVCMIDPWSGGGYDGLCANGPNMNQGAESTLALISTLQCALVVMGP
jgi:hypothetical protein